MELLVDHGRLGVLLPNLVLLFSAFGQQEQEEVKTKLCSKLWTDLKLCFTCLCTVLSFILCCIFFIILLVKLFKIHHLNIFYEESYDMYAERFAKTMVKV